eukprot:scaffold15736_cov114-Isochrysis_galbana.AAC.3
MSPLRPSSPVSPVKASVAGGDASTAISESQTVRSLVTREPLYFVLGWTRQPVACSRAARSRRPSGSQRRLGLISAGGKAKAGAGDASAAAAAPRRVLIEGGRSVGGVNGRPQASIFFSCEWRDRSSARQAAEVTRLTRRAIAIKADGLALGWGLADGKLRRGTVGEGETRLQLGGTTRPQCGASGEGCPHNRERHGLADGGVLVGWRAAAARCIRVGH